MESSRRSRGQEVGPVILPNPPEARRLRRQLMVDRDVVESAGMKLGRDISIGFDRVAAILRAVGNSRWFLHCAHASAY